MFLPRINYAVAICLNDTLNHTKFFIADARIIICKKSFSTFCNLKLGSVS